MPDRHRNRKGMKCVRVIEHGRMKRKWIPREQDALSQDSTPNQAPDGVPLAEESNQHDVSEIESQPDNVPSYATTQDDSENSGSSGSHDNVCKVWPTAKPKTCDKCGETFPSITQFNAHRGTCKKYKCPQCDLRFSTAKEFEKHTETHRVRFHCDQCETEPFLTQGALDNHKKIAHGVAITCPHCSQTFCRVDKLNHHIKNKHNLETANKCACGATYVLKWQLERHEQDCIVSPIGGAKAVKRKYEELSQMQMPESDPIDHAALALKAFDTVRDAAQKKLKLCCDTCGTSFKDKESLKRHIRKKHPRSTSSAA